MLEYEPYTMLDDAQESLSWHIARGEFEKALQIYIEHKKEIPASRRRFYFSCIQDGISGYKSHRRVLRTAIAMLIVNLLILPVFSLQLLDIFAFLSGRFFYYNYYSALLPHIINALFVLGLMFQWHIWVALPRKLFERKVESPYRIGFFVLIALVSGYMASQIVPFAKDLPMVQNGEYLIRSINEDEHTAMVYGQIILTTDREDVAAALRQELRDNYGRNYPDDDFPIHFYTSEKRLWREVILIYIEAEDSYYAMSRLQMRATAFSINKYPIVIKYLPHSKTILRIVNGEE